MQVEYVKGWGSFKSANEISVTPSEGGDETIIKTKNVIIATGSEPSSVPGLTVDEDKCVITDRSFSRLRSCPLPCSPFTGPLVWRYMSAVTRDCVCTPARPQADSGRFAGSYRPRVQ